MKISIITYTRTKNYGGILQAYALYSYLVNCGHDVEFIDYVPERCNIDNPDIFVKNILRNSRVWGKTSLTRNIWKYLKFPKIRDSYEPFINFLREKTKFSQTFYSNDELKSNYPKSDLYITGSDQVWNSSFCRNENIDLPFYFDFLNNERRISYASSFGIETIPKKNQEIVYNCLKKYENISVREESGVQLLDKLGLNAKKVLDPTLLCDKSVFDNLCFSPLEKNYYVLYQVHFDDKTYEMSLELAKKANKQLVVISIDKDGKKSNKNCLFVSPSINEWLTYIKYSDGVITDSFHACIFSILFEKSFLVNTGIRKKMSTRIDNLLETLNLNERKFNDFIVDDAYRVLESKINWNECNELLSTERNKSRKWLNEAIKSELKNE